MNIYILSWRGLISTVSFDPVYELEDLLVQTCNGKLLVPTARGLTQWVHEHPNYGSKFINKIINRTVGPYKQLDDALPSWEKPNILFVFGIYEQHLRILSSLPRWRQNFDIIVMGEFQKLTIAPFLMPLTIQVRDEFIIDPRLGL